MITNANPNKASDIKPPSLSASEIDKLLSKTLIANLATLGQDNTIHMVPMWFLRRGNAIYIPTSRHTRKYKNLVARPHASVMIDVSCAGLDSKGVLVQDRVELVEGEEARKINDEPVSHPNEVAQLILDAANNATAK